jgi:ribosomal protein S18 acetylase RimI-like enzyme
MRMGRGREAAIMTQKRRLHVMKTKRRADLKKEFQIHPIADSEAKEAAQLIARLKKLNCEFDPLLKTGQNLDTDSLRILKERIHDENFVILVAKSGSRIVGVVKGVLRDRIYYEPRKEGAIVEFYIMPEYRRGNLGRELFDTIVSSLGKKGALLITAEFPTQNEIARRFYTKLGFRSLTNLFARPSS